MSLGRWETVADMRASHIYIEWADRRLAHLCDRHSGTNGSVPKVSLHLSKGIYMAIIVTEN
ncbi:MAG: hypothetical protein P2A85_12840 [Microcoleus anatoxicus]|uniref:hypothetical protein n=1 Tax=Microcoleus anatoxicus TaxID=2705319 RepID=UPI00366FB39B